MNLIQSLLDAIQETLAQARAARTEGGLRGS